MTDIVDQMIGEYAVLRAALTGLLESHYRDKPEDRQLESVALDVLKELPPKHGRASARLLFMLAQAQRAARQGAKG